MPADGLAAFILRAARAVSLSLPFALSLSLAGSVPLLFYTRVVENSRGPQGGHEARSEVRA